MTMTDPPARTQHTAWSVLRPGWGYGIIILAALILALILKYCVVDAVAIPSVSMEPSLLRGDNVLVDKISLGSKLPLLRLPALGRIRRNDILVFRLPHSAELDAPDGRGLFVKRCVALGGDSVRIANGWLSINGVPSVQLSGPIREGPPLYVPRKGDIIRLDPSRRGEWLPVLLNEGHTVTYDDTIVCVDGVPASEYTARNGYLFMLGDNERHSYDSRHWGPLPDSLVVGRAIMVFWSVDNGQNSRAVRWSRIGNLVE